MDIIAHTASVFPSRRSLVLLKYHPIYTKIELDFHFTKDGELICSHSNHMDGHLIANTNYRDFRYVFTLEDVLEILGNSKDLLIELKNYPVFLQKRGCLLLKALAGLKYCEKQVEIESFNEHLIATLLELQKNEELASIKLGLIINLFKTFKYRKCFPKECRDVSFVALSNELFEWPIVNGDYQIYREILPHVKEYAWSWDALYKETSRRIENYIVKGVDGIATSNPFLVRELLRK